MRTPPFVAGLLLAGFLIPAIGADRAAVPMYREQPDDPPAMWRARDSAAARSPGMRAVAGPYVSVQVNVDGAGQNIVGDAANECSITVDPTNRDRMVIGWRQFDNIASNFRQGGWGFTTDGGATWTFPGVLTPGEFRSDPVLDADANGRVFYQSLNGDFLIDVFTSLNGGATWGSPVSAFGGDKNWVAVDRSGGPGDGNVYGVWQRFFGCCGLATFTRSVDSALSFESPAEIDRYPTFGTMAVGPDGEVYAAGIEGTNNQDFDTIVVSRSLDAENPGSRPSFTGTVVDLDGSLGFSSGPNPAGLLGQVNVAVDSSNGPTRGNVYVLSTVVPSGSDPAEVHFSRSTDGGDTWSPAVRVNDDASGNWQWFGALAVAPDGRIDAIWNDTRASGQVNLSELYYAYSYDAGQTWSPNVAASPVFDSFLGWPSQNKLGDYYTLVADESGADVAYAATFNGEQDVYHVRLFPDCNDNGTSDVVDVASGVAPDCDENLVPDGCQAVAPSCDPAGDVPDGGPVTSTPLVAERIPGGVRLAWDASCLSGDTDYAVYEGSIGEFAGHEPRACTTSGAVTFDVEPANDDAYYLVVPRNPGREGSYGRDSAGAERPAGAASCVPQAIGVCPR